MSNRIKSDNDLMKEFGGCSFEAYRLLFEKYKNRILNYISRSYKMDIDRSEDIVQQVFIKVFESKYRYKTNFQFSTWIYTIARNKTIDALRGTKNHSELEAAENIHSPSAPAKSAEKEEAKRMLAQAVDSLSEIQREVIIMRYKLEMSFDEISQITSLKINTLKSHARRGLQKLEKELKGMDYDFA